MDKVRFLIEYFFRKPFLVILASILVMTVPIALASATTLSQAERTDRQTIVRQVAQKWIQVGMEQYKRGFFKEAEQSFLRAQDYEEYLTVTEREKLTAVLETIHITALERKRILEHIQTANELVDQGELNKAKAHLEGVKDSEFLNEEERALVVEGLKNIESQLKGQTKEFADLYNRSVELYDIGELEKAREGFLKIVKSDLSMGPKGQRAEDYLMKIDYILAERIRLPGLVEEKRVAVEEPLVTEREAVEAVAAKARVPEPEIREVSYIEKIDRRRNILQSYTRAVVNDAVAKAQNYITQGEFDKAKEEVELAERTVKKNQFHLGDELFSHYSVELKVLKEGIVKGENTKARQLQEQQRLEAIKTQHEYRQQVEADRRKRMAELMDGAIAYQKQQRYEEALGQLESLLALEPLNDQALILKQTLDDTVSFRRQLEIQKEKGKEKTELLLRTDEAGIPFAEEITYPKNWREISASIYRKPAMAIGKDEATAFVYKQLAEVVDLSQFRQEMRFGDALEIIKVSVDPPLKIIVLWRDLYDNADIDQTTPINMDPVSAIPLGTGLELLLQSVSGAFAQLGYVVDEGVITIATVGSLPSEMETLVYDVTDLLGQPASFYAPSAAGAGGAGSTSIEQAGQYQQQQQQQEQLGWQERGQQAATRATSLVMLIQDTIEPDTWYDYGGEGSVTVYENKKLIVRQTRKIHTKIEQLLEDLRMALGHQVAIEARFLVVSENFLEDIGLDIDIPFLNIGGKWGLWRFQQSSSSFTLPEATKVPSSLGGVDPDTGIPLTLGATISGTYGSILDDLQVSFLIRATQAHRESTILTAPKVNVLSGESATLQIQRAVFWASDIDIDTTSIGAGIGQAAVTWDVDFETGVISTGSLLNITPTITPDKKHVLLNIVAELQDFLGFRSQTVQVPIFGQAGVAPTQALTIQFPETEFSRVETRVSVPDRGTLLLGGQKITAEVEKESGVPILSKIPLIGRAFSNRSKIRESKILLILVKPTIILQEEAEAKAVAAMESGL